MVVLNVGCGPTRIAGEIGVDLHPTGGCDVQADLMALPFRDGSVDGVRLDHVLEHLDQRAAFAALAEARRVLKQCGTITVGVPDLAQYADAWLEGPVSLAEKSMLLRGIYGGQTHAGEYHRSGWDADILIDVLGAVGFRDVHVRDDDGPFRTEGYCITASGVKASGVGGGESNPEAPRPARAGQGGSQRGATTASTTDEDDSR